MRLLFAGTLVVASCVAILADQTFTPSAPTLIVSLQGGQFKGNPSQMTWSPDSTMLCVQTLEGNSPPFKSRFYLIPLQDHTFRGADVAPEWAAAYWQFKSARNPPGQPELQIEVETLHQNTDVPTQSLSDKAKLGLRDNAVAAQNVAGNVTYVLKLKGEVVGQYVNQPLVPGMTFGWSPATLHAMAYAKPDGRLSLLDLNAAQIDLAGTKDAILPAWSPDGSQIVYLQKKGRHDYDVMSVSVKRQ
jgi:hypothetical protein